MSLRCDGCGRIMAREDKRRKPGDRLKPVDGVTLEKGFEGRATRLKCGCGRVLILLQGAA